MIQGRKTETEREKETRGTERKAKIQTKKRDVRGECDRTKDRKQRIKKNDRVKKRERDYGGVLPHPCLWDPRERPE